MEVTTIMLQTTRWLNPPAAWRAEGDALHVTTRGGTDFWRKTHNDQLRDDGHFYGQTVAGGFTAAVRVVGHYRDQYDQAGLMLRLDETHWIKCGIEFFEGVQQASAVVTRAFSDWSILPLHPAPPALWLRLLRHGHTVEVRYSLDGAAFHLLRQTYFPPTRRVQIGLMCCSPVGGGFDVTFEGFRVEP